MASVGPVYDLKKIKFLGRDLPIILQNVNGPCPLIALANVLLLRGTIKISTDYARISNDELISIIAEHIVDSNKSIRTSKELQADLEKNISDSISLLPRLQFGLDVNVRFRSPKDFEYTPECVLFDIVDIDLVHGWILDPQTTNTIDEEVYQLISSLSYNQLMEKLIAMSAVLESNHKPQETKSLSITQVTVTDEIVNNTETVSVTTTETQIREVTNENTTKLSPRASPATPKKHWSENLDPKVVQATISSLMESNKQMSAAELEKIIKEGQLVEKWIQDTPGQLTFHGITELHKTLNDNQLCVFFRNNHFATLFKYKGNLYELITDTGFKNEPVIWEKLDMVDNDTVFYRDDFTEFKGSLLPPMLEDAVNAVSNTISNLLPIIESNGIAPSETEKKLMASTELNVDYQPDDAEIQQQLLIEQRILLQKKEEAEQRDRELAYQLHQEELRDSQKKKKTKDSGKKQPKEKDKEKEKDKAKTSSDEKKDKDCIIM